MENEKRNQFGVCPYVTSQRLLSGKWSIYLMFLLRDAPVRFNELQRRMPENMTHTTLSRQLKLLEDEGLIVRKVYVSTDEVTGDFFCDWNIAGGSGFSYAIFQQIYWDRNISRLVDHCTINWFLHWCQTRPVFRERPKAFLWLKRCINGTDHRIVYFIQGDLMNGGENDEED